MIDQKYWENRFKPFRTHERWTFSEIEDLQRELMALSSLNGIHAVASDALASLGFDVIDSRKLKRLMQSAAYSLRFAASTATDEGKFWQTRFADELEHMLKDVEERISPEAKINELAVNGFLAGFSERPEDNIKNLHWFEQSPEEYGADELDATPTGKEI